MSSLIAAPERRGTEALSPSFAVSRSLPNLGSRLLLPALLLYSGFLFFYGLTKAELYRTENLRAIIAADYLRSGNWIVPKLYGEPLFTKPPGMYVAIALSSLPHGRVTELTARLPSALAATITVLLFYWCFRRSFGRRAGFVAALILPASLMWLDKVPTAEIDALQTAWVAGAIVCLLRALEAEETSEVRASRAVSAWWLASLLCVAGGVLTKWTAPAFFYGAVIPLLAWRGQLHLLWSRQHLLSAAIAGGLCCIWIAAAVTQTGWDVFYDTVSREALQRLSRSHHEEAMQAMQMHEHLPAWADVLIHPVRIFAANLPWSAFALLALRPSFLRRWDAKGKLLLQAFHCWVWPNVIFWSVIPEHAVRHSFPLFPGVAGLAAMVWIDWLQLVPIQTPVARFTPAPGRAAVALAVLMCAWLVTKIVFVEAVIPARNPNRAPHAKGAELAAVVPEGEMLYLFHLKDEGIMFYYGRPVQRLAGPDELPATADGLYCILDEPEWRQWNPARPAQALLHLQDEQGAPIVLVRVGSS